MEDDSKKIEELEKQNKEYLEGWKKERASLLNYKKEEMERIVDLLKYANEEIILKLLPILDNCLTAEKNIPEGLKKDEHIKGVLQIYQQIRDFLKSQGIEEIKAVGEKFDPNFMEAVEEVEGQSPNIVIEETQRGYKLNDKIIRPAKVKVSK